MKPSLRPRSTRLARFALGCASMAATVALDPAAVHAQALDLSREVAVVRRHMQAPQAAAALDFVERQIADPRDVIQDWLGVCNAHGPSQDEVFRARHIYKMFRIYGLEQVYIDDAYNVVAMRPGTGDGPTVVLTAHHDNVAIWPKEQPIEAFERDGRVYCPAAGDDIPGVVQLLTVARAMNEAGVQTTGDVWFVTLSGEETGSTGAEHFARAHYPHNLDWRRGDAVVQLHGGSGQGVTTGSGPVVVRATLRFFTPFERQIEEAPGADRRWRPHAVDVLARALVRIRTEVTDPRPDCLRCSGLRHENVEGAEQYLNVSVLEGSPVVNRPASEASVRMDLRAKTLPQLTGMYDRIKGIAEELCTELSTTGFAPHNYRERCSYVFDVNEVYGRDWASDPIEGWDLVNNTPARFVAAAGQALYGFEPNIDPSRGCGDCINMYKVGMPSFSFRGSVVDHGGGRVDREAGERERRGGHDVTESMDIDGLWAGVKHALVFAVSYAGMPGVAGRE
jgi:acetylornithine deacetylase/succinyl-diaminopimelate desuccinylase-like protein